MPLRLRTAQGKAICWTLLWNQGAGIFDLGNCLTDVPLSFWYLNDHSSFPGSFLFLPPPSHYPTSLLQWILYSLSKVPGSQLHTSSETVAMSGRSELPVCTEASWTTLRPPPHLQLQKQPRWRGFGHTSLNSISPQSPLPPPLPLQFQIAQWKVPQPRRLVCVSSGARSPRIVKTSDLRSPVTWAWVALAARD